MKILLITVSARGHAIAEAMRGSSQNPEIIHVCQSRNPGILKLSDKQIIVDSIMEFGAIIEAAKNTKPDFAFVAPDDPIGAGLVDALADVGVKSVAPKRMLARIESSKGFARELLTKHGIGGNPKFKVFKLEDCSLDSVKCYMEDALHGDYVVKFDGLAGGKGVKVSGEHLKTTDEGVEFAAECMQKSGRVVIEEKLVGDEFSLMSFVSGSKVISMPAVQDHKRAYDGNIGPNTGGMGSYSDANHSLPFLSESDIYDAHAMNMRAAEALYRECDSPFVGILYGGFMRTNTGIRLIEYNARFGDPECLNVLPLLETDFVDICQAMLSGDLDGGMVKFSNKATVCVYIVPKCYPQSKNLRGAVVTLPNVPENARIYYGDVSEGKDGLLHLGGSRAAGIVGIGNTVEEARKTALSVCEKAAGPVRFRRDIGLIS